jgi:hypothetical protein
MDAKRKDQQQRKHQKGIMKKDGRATKEEVGDAGFSKACCSTVPCTQWWLENRFETIQLRLVWKTQDISAANLLHPYNEQAMEGNTLFYRSRRCQAHTSY